MSVKSYYHIFDSRSVLRINSDIKNCIKSGLAAKIVKGNAIIRETLINSMTAEIWTELNTLPFPVKKFSNFEEGLHRVKELKVEQLMKKEAATRA